jgi:hypothetical protein
MKIVRTNTYARAVKRLAKVGATAEDVAAMEAAIAANPLAGDVIKRSGGLRKLRFAYGQAGKRGGGRVVYFAWIGEDTVILLTAYPKVDKDDLSPEELKLFKALLKELTDG